MKYAPNNKSGSLQAAALRGLTAGVHLAIAVALAGGALRAQEEHGVTPFQIQRGEQIFLSNCANCHGPDGNSIPGVDLASGKFRHATTDQDLMNVIRNGIPGTPMPPSNYPEAQAATIVAYIRSMKDSAPAIRSSLQGDAARGKAIFEGKGRCLTCHQTNGSGSSFLGPDLSEIGGIRRTADLERSVIDPNAEIRADHRTLRVVKSDGTTILGRLLNQDTESVQMLSSNGKLMSFPKAELREFDIMKTSPMPSYKNELTGQELADLIQYLGTLRRSNR